MKQCKTCGKIIDNPDKVCYFSHIPFCSEYCVHRYAEIKDRELEEIWGEKITIRS